MNRYKLINICVSTVCIFLSVLILAICVVKIPKERDRRLSKDSHNIGTSDRINSGEQQAAPQETAENLDQLPLQGMPEVPLIDLTRLPQGYRCETQNGGNTRIFKDRTVIGAVDVYTIPDGEQIAWDPYFRGLGNLGIPDLEDESLCYMGGSSLYGNWEMHFESDLPPGQTGTVNRYHTFYVGRTEVWDVWFDLTVIERSEMNLVLEAITLR